MAHWRHGPRPRESNFVIFFSASNNFDSLLHGSRSSKFRRLFNRH